MNPQPPTSPNPHALPTFPPPRPRTRSQTPAWAGFVATLRKKKISSGKTRHVSRPIGTNTAIQKFRLRYGNFPIVDSAAARLETHAKINHPLTCSPDWIVFCELRILEKRLSRLSPNNVV
ncbi:hypothetical protein M404DRAFT_669881 [Pisolithus tinctorius Marx 270]|uniref:Uncharacterized protein n=1 Tax=Pisolithus tinctorius Marx 270 TaxID=870435 RepID=A0A0C3JYI6_PISTI|nr:hypothetical protein M404DRAFT_669881 [Pisolithus tinctorius Marx 270]